MKVRFYEGPLDVHGGSTAGLCVTALAWDLKAGQAVCWAGDRASQGSLPLSLPPQTHLCSLLTQPGNKIRSPRDLRAEAEVTFGDELNVLVRRRRAVLWGFVFCSVFSCSLVPWNVLSTDNALMQEHIGISSSVFSWHSPGALPLSVGTGRRNHWHFLLRKHC